MKALKYILLVSILFASCNNDGVVGGTIRFSFSGASASETNI